MVMYSCLLIIAGEELKSHRHPFLAEPNSPVPASNQVIHTKPSYLHTQHPLWRAAHLDGIARARGNA